MTPCGMKFSTLAGTVGGGNQVPGFVGHSKHYITSKKFILAEGGIKRIVWMPSALKEEVAEVLGARAEAEGLSKDFVDMIADENSATSEEEVMEELYKHWEEDEKRYIQETRRFSEQLSETLQAEKNYSIHDGDDSWDANSLREEAKSVPPENQNDRSD